MQEKDPLFVKIIIVGDSGVGKTSLLNRFCYSKFDPTIAPTIGTDFSTKLVKKNETTLRLQLWDIAGQERFKSVSKMYIRGCLGCVMVADITQERTLLSLVDWKRVVLENADYLGEDYRIPFLVLENKLDLLKTQANVNEANFEEILKAKKKKLDEFAGTNGCDLAFLTSAKENINLEEAFMRLSEKIVVQLEGKARNEKDNNFNGSFKVDQDVTLGSPKKKKDKKCCL